MNKQLLPPVSKVAGPLKVISINVANVVMDRLGKAFFRV